MSDDESKDFLELPYSSRQLIVITEDALVEASERAERKASQKQELALDWLGVVKSVVMPVFPGGSLAISLSEMAIEAYRGWGRAKASGLPVLSVKRTAASGVIFPIGHPRDGVVYVGHPTTPRVYYPMADFHRKIFEHKLCEAVGLLMSLGAVKIRVEHISGWSEDFSARISVPLGVGHNVAGQAGSHSKAQTKILYEAQLSGTGIPALPTDLVWYNHEPTWQAIAGGRLNHALQNFSISVSYTDDFGIHALIHPLILLPTETRQTACC
jgi:hypothetical protein